MLVRRCKHEILIISGQECADCTGLSQEYSEALKKDQRVMAAIMSRRWSAAFFGATTT